MESTRTGRDDASILGSGKSSLVCAAMLARSGREVRVMERQRVLGARIRTDELTLQGMRRGTLSTAQPLSLASRTYAAAVGKPLQATVLTYCNTESPTGVLLPDGRHPVLSTSRDTNRGRFGRR